MKSIIFLLLMLPGVLLGQQADSSFWLLHTESKGITYIDDTTFKWEPKNDLPDIIGHSFKGDCAIEGFPFTIEKGSESVFIEGENIIHLSPLKETWAFCRYHNNLIKISSQQTTTIYYNPTK